MFVDGHEQSDMVEDHTHFMKKMEGLKLYMVEFFYLFFFFKFYVYIQPFGL